MQKVIYVSLVSTLVLSSCGSEPKKEEAVVAPVVTVDSAKTALNEETDFKFHVTVANIPSPFETINNLAKADAGFKKELTNAPENESKYLTSTKKALNYGTYGVDLIYLASNKEGTHITKYFTATRNLAVSLDAAESFDKITKSRSQNSWENRDTVTRMVDEAFAATDAYLRSSERQQVASQILTGSWIESQFITVNTLKGQKKDAKNGFIFQQIYEQKLHLTNLTNLLKDYEKENDFKPLIDKLLSLNEDFKKIKTVDDITDEKVNEIADKLKVIREMVVK